MALALKGQCIAICFREKHPVSELTSTTEPGGAGWPACGRLPKRAPAKPPCTHSPRPTQTCNDSRMLLAEQGPSGSVRTTTKPAQVGAAGPSPLPSVPCPGRASPSQSRAAGIHNAAHSLYSGKWGCGSQPVWQVPSPDGAQ